MIELTFGLSTAGSLKLIKSLNQFEHLGGSPLDVEVLSLALDIGDISDLETGMNARKKLLEDMFFYSRCARRNMGNKSTCPDASARSKKIVGACTRMDLCL